MTTTLLMTARVPDYDTWKPLYEETVSKVPEIREYRVWHGQDDPNTVVIMEEYDSREFAEGLLSSPEMQKEMADHGVSSIQTYFLDEG